jgi:hypothetical protein
MGLSNRGGHRTDEAGKQALLISFTEDRSGFQRK